MTGTERGIDAESVAQRIIDMGVPGVSEDEDAHYEGVREFLRGLHPETVALLSEELSAEGGEHIHAAVIDLVYFQHASMRAREARLRELMLLIDRDERADPDANLALVEGLHCIGLLEQRPDMTRGDERHIAVCKALVKVAREAAGIEDERGHRVHVQEGVAFVTDPHLTRIVMDHPERAEEIAAFVRDRRSLDWQAIAAALDVTPPLRPGTL